MGDVENGDAIGAEFFHEIEQAVGVLLGERGGGLVEDEDLGGAAEGAGDLEQLFLRHAQFLDRAFDVELGSDAGEQGAGAGGAGAPGDDRAVLAEQEIFGDGEFGEEGGVLVNDGEAEGLHLARGGVVDHGIAEADLGARIGVDDTAGDFDQGAFAGAIFTQQGVNLAGAELELDPAQGAHARVGLGYVAKLKHRGAEGVRRATGRRWTMSVLRRRKSLMVPGSGLEPLHLSAQASETCVSTNSTTRAGKGTAKAFVG